MKTFRTTIVEQETNEYVLVPKKKDLCAASQGLMERAMSISDVFPETGLHWVSKYFILYGNAFYFKYYSQIIHYLNAF